MDLRPHTRSFLPQIFELLLFLTVFISRRLARRIGKPGHFVLQPWFNRRVLLSEILLESLEKQVLVNFLLDAGRFVVRGVERVEVEL